MKAIWKWDIPLGDEFSFKMPKGAKILCIQEQHDFPKLLAIVDTSQEGEERRFITYGTGHEMRSGDHVYVGTYQLHRGRLVFHVFEIAEASA